MAPLNMNGHEFPAMNKGWSERSGVEHLINDALTKAAMVSLWQSSKLPLTNILETENKYIVELSAPGLRKKDFHVDLINHILEISAEHEEEKSVEKKWYDLKEFKCESFCRSFSLAERVDAEKIEAHYEDGILKIILPKTVDTKVLFKEIAVV